MGERHAFAGGDQDYLRGDQYGTTAKLATRGDLHTRFGTSPISLASFEAGLISWPADAEVLECGSGTGMFWRNGITPTSSRLTLTDLSPAMVEAASAVAAEHGFGAVTGRSCDVQDLPFDDDSFDVVIANHMLYHVPDPDRALAELARVMRPDGVALVATNGRGHMAAIVDAIREVFDNYPDELYDVFGIDSGEARLRDHFTSITWHAFANDLLVDDLGAAEAYARSFPPAETAAPAEVASLRAALERRTVDGVLRVRTRAGVFVCRHADLSVG